MLHAFKLLESQFIFLVELTRSALVDDTVRVGDTVVFICSITNGTSLAWRWNDTSIVTYTADQHDKCGDRALDTESGIVQAEIYKILAVVVGEEDNANCTSLLEITPTRTFSIVNIACIGLDSGPDPPSPMTLSFSARMIPPGIINQIVVLSWICYSVV